MDKEAAEALGRRAVACNGWRWLPGMLATNGAMMIGQQVGSEELIFADPADEGAAPHWVWPSHLRDWCPNLTDPATLGCLLALVREAWGRHSVITMPGFGRWGIGFLVDGGIQSLGVSGLTEAEALVAALEAAPQERA